MCQAFTDCGHEVLLTGRASPQAIVLDPIGHYGLSGGFGVSLRHLGRLLDNVYTRKLLLPGLLLALCTHKCFKTFQPDLVYSRLTVAALVAVPPGVPIIYEMHSLGPLGRGGFERVLFKWLMRRKRVARIVVTTTSLAEVIRAQLPHIDVRVARLSAERPVEMDAAKLEQFREANLQGSEFKAHVGYTGYLDTIGLRGADVMCRAASLTPEAAFHIVGGDPHIVAHWKEYASQHNQHGNIFFYGHRNPSEMPLFLGCFDIVLAPLQFKTSERAPTGMGMSPLKLPQYMSYGKAIVASDLLSHREILEHGKTALLVEPADAVAWSAAIRQLLNNPEQRSRIGRNAREGYFSGFTPERRVNGILEGLKMHGKEIDA